MYRAICGFAACLAFCLGAASQAQDDPPPSAADLLAPSALYSPQMSPDGTRLVYLRHSQPGEPDGVAIRVIDLTTQDFETVSYQVLEGKTVSWVNWANNDRLLVSLEVVAPIDRGGALVYDAEGELRVISEVTRRQIIAVNVDGSQPAPLFDFQDRRFNSLGNLSLDRVIDFLPDDPEHILIPARAGRQGYLNVYRVNVYTGEEEQIARGSYRTVAWFTNGAGVPVMRWDMTNAWRNVRIRARSGEGDRWRTVARMTASDFGRLNQDYTWVARAEQFDEALVFARSENTGTTGLFRYSFLDNTLIEPVFLNEDYDVDDVYVDPFTGRLSAIKWADAYTHIEVLDDELATHLQGLASFFGPEVMVTPLQRAGSRLLLSVRGPREPQSYYVYDLDAYQVSPVGTASPRLQNRALSAVEVFEYRARDGQNLFGYLTLPAAPAASPPPLVVMPHGGPERRDYYGFDPMAQLVAAEGYAVFQPQFRGSSGFGQAFAEAGYGQMGGLIQNDITDGVQSLLASGRVDPDRVCVAGWSFGGYSALMQPILNPGLYRCAFAGAPVTHLEQMLNWHRSFEDEDERTLEYVERMLGHPDLAAMQASSPALRAAELGVPVLIMHGEADRIVPYEQSELMLEALEAVGAEATLTPFSGGHSPDLDGEMVTVNFHMGRFLQTYLQPEPATSQSVKTHSGADPE